MKEYQLSKPFTPVALVKFRKRFNAKRLAKINEMIIRAEKAQQTYDEPEDNHDDPDGPGAGPNVEEQEEPTQEVESPSNKGSLMLDATCTPADMKYPADLGLLNEAREKMDLMIDVLHEANGKPGKRPRTYRMKARKEYLNIAKQKSPRKKSLRQAVKKQLQYCRRNLSIVEQMRQQATVELSPKQEKLLKTIKELYEQQVGMYKAKSHSVGNRIVNLHQPQLRPIVRGKAGKMVEFGAKVSISLEQGYSRIEKLSWAAYNEAATLIESIEQYKDRNGYYPEVVLADRIYRNRDNLAYCKKHGIRLSGPKLGRPAATEKQKAEKETERQDGRARNAVESKFGEGKRKYGLARIFAKRKDTSECVIAMQFLVMNLEHKLRVFFAQILFRLFGRNSNVFTVG